MSIKKSAIIVFSLIFLMFFGCVSTSVWMLIRSNDSLNKVNKEIRVVLSVVDPINHSRSLRVKLMEYMEAIREDDGMLIANSDGFRDMANEADRVFQEYENASRLKGEYTDAESYKRTYLEYRRNGIQPLIEAAEAHDLIGFRKLLPTVIRLDKQFETELHKILARHEAYAKELNETAHNDFRHGVIFLILIGGVFCFIIIVISFLIRRFVLTPLLSAVTHCNQIAEGHLDSVVTVKIGSRSEIHNLMNSLEYMRKSLVKIISQVNDSAGHVLTSSSEIASGNIDLASRTEQQAAALTETAASMEELGATVKQNAHNVSNACRLTAEAVEHAEYGEKLSQDVITLMGVINSGSKKIEDIINVINGIAFQTNILALNAAVEAARAGGQGRGFAVVASEVRNLAQRTAVAAKEIEILIAESVKIIHQGYEQVTNTGDAMGNIISSVEKVNVIMENISIALDEQNRGVEQIEKAVSEMDAVTQQNSALVQESASAASSLEEQAHHLTQAVSIFKLSRG